MYAQRCSTSKMFLCGRGNSPKSTFLSPANKYGQRSYSASSLNSSLHTPKPLPGSLRQQIRLDAFKKTLADSKLSKSSLHRTALKVQPQSASMFRSDPRSEVRDLQRQNSMLRQQNLQLKQQRSSDLMLITKQNELLGRLEAEINDLKDYGQRSQHQCECYLIEQYLETIRGLQMKVAHLEEEKKEFKTEIRQLVIKQEQLKGHIEERENQQMERESNRREREKESNKREWQREKEKQKEREKQRQREKQRERERERDGESRMQREKKKQGRQFYDKKDSSHRPQQRERPRPPGGQGVMRYMQYLKNIRNREIDQIQNILNE